MQPYLNIVKKILEEGVEKTTRTGTSAMTIAGAIFEHDMAKGFPMLTTKKVAFNSIKTELEFFIKGITDKEWLKKRKNTIWNEWANPEKAPYGHTEEAKKKMAEERDLGPVYGFQWRHFGAAYNNYDSNYDNKGVDQLKNLGNSLKNDPASRRMIVSAWNPAAMDKMALPPCHYAFQAVVTKDRLSLLWSQRSVDTMLGLPFNIASYGLLLHLLAKEANLKEGKLVGFLGDVHIYTNHIAGAKEQLSRDPDKYPLPAIQTENFKGIFSWKSEDTKVLNYQSYPKIEFQIAV